MSRFPKAEKLCLELSCPICLEYFKEPLSLSCGHNFCQSCLDQCWEGKEASCPQCREKVQEGDIRPNRQLVNVVEIVKELGSQKAEEKGSICQKHQEPLKLFCKDHETPICVVCDKSKEHKNHKVIPLDEASKEYKVGGGKIGTPNKVLWCISPYNPVAVVEKDKTAAAFRRMHQFLEEQERNLLAKMDEVEKEISAKGEEHLARLSEELSSLSKLIQEMEEKLQQPASELLQVRPRLSPWVAETSSLAVIQSLAWKIWDVCDINPFLKGVMKQFRAHVTLDPDTAHPQLILSEDLRRVIYGEKKQDLPDNPERFCDYAYVLGQNGFTEGRHFWEVLVENGEEWSVGIARMSVERKDPDFGPNTGNWEVGKWESAYRFSSNNESPSLTLSKEPKRIRVTLNYEGGRVAFYDADSAALILEYPPASFSGETLLPCFCVTEKAQLELSP
uniref:Tripartite motif containing 39 n=1 Tax=Anolis carolinensis TaxID=28377 RepID=A0A803SLE2_ANOCA